MMVSGWLASPQFAAHPSVVTRADLSLPPSPPPLYTHNGTRVSGRCINRKIEISASTIITAIVASNRERFSLSPVQFFKNPLLPLLLAREAIFSPDIGGKSFSSSLFETEETEEREERCKIEGGGGEETLPKG